MKLAAIDIGSNAVRLQITKVIEYHQRVTFKKLEYIRFPLRLGHDVFITGKIGEHNKKRFRKLMIAFKHFIDLYEVDAFYGCATSAMREAANGHAIIGWVRDELNLDVKIISGDEEAELINKVVKLSLDDENYIHVDVGGGSTELNIYERRRKVNAASFKIGSVRKLEQVDQPQVWTTMRDWIRKHVSNKYRKIKAIGTGGNISKLFALSSENQASRKINLNVLIETWDALKSLSLQERLNQLQLNPDRADVIIPAAEIYIEVMEATGATTMLVPDVGLKDGINYHLYEMNRPVDNKVFVKN